MLKRRRTAHRTAYRLRGIVACAAVAAAGIAAPAASADWPGFHGGAGQDRLNSFYPGLSVGQLWAGPTAPSVDRCVVQSAGRVFTLVPDPSDSTLASLHAVDETTGATVWQTTSFPIGPMCPAVDGSHVYVGEAYSAAHTPSFNAYNISNGTPAWSYSFSGAYGGETSGSPTVAGSTVYVSGCGDTCGVANGCLFAFDATTGAELWAAPFASQAEAAPVVDGSAVLQIQRSSPGVTALSTSTGATLWSDSNADGSPVADGSNVFYASQPTGPQTQGAVLYSKVASTGAINWSTTLPTGAIPEGIVVDGTRVLILINSYNSTISRVLAYSETDGSLLWGTSESSPDGWIVGEFGNTLYTTSDAFDTSTGAILGSSPYSSLEFVDGSAYDAGSLFTWVDKGGYDYQLVALRDVTAPSISPSSPADDSATTDTRPTFNWTASDGAGAGIAHINFLLNGNPVADGLAPTATSYTPAAALPDGNYTWQIRATDNVGNVSTTIPRAISIDTQPPTAPAPQQRARQATVTQSEPTVSWTASSDATSGVDHYNLVLDGGAVLTVSTSACQAGTCQYTPSNALADAPHTWTIAGVDRAGNASSTQSASFTVAVAPRASFAAPATALTGQQIMFDASQSSDANSTLTDYAWDFDGSASYSQNANSAQTITHTFTAPGHYVVDLRVRDAAGLTADAQQTIDVRQAPPAGEVGVSIDNGAYATNNPHVQLDLVWPAGANQAIASNDGGFNQAGTTQTLALAPRVNWTLEQTGPDRLPKTVYVRFLGAGVDLSTFTDDIILDQTPPQLSSAQLIGPAATAQATVAAASRKLRSYSIKLHAKDAIAGVCAVEASPSRTAGGQIVTLRTCLNRGIVNLARTVRVKASTAPRYVRVRNSAGTWSRRLRLGH